MDYFNPKKTLGQHFLKDLKIADKIVNSLNRDKKDLIIEIGPGKVLSGLIKRIDKKVKVSAINNEEDIKTIKI